MSTALRSYQQQMIADGRQAFVQGNRKLLFVAPTGSGKTRVGVEFVTNHLAKSPAHRVLWLAHRIELVTQAADRLEAEGIPAPWVLAGDVQRGRNDARVVVASVETLAARPESAVAGVTLLILDECHHYVSQEWVSVARAYPVTTIGLTATPCRSDGTALGELFNVIVPGPSISLLTQQGYLVPCEVIAPSKFQKDLAEAPVSAYQRLCPGGRAVTFCLTVKQAQEVADEFSAAGIPSGYIEANTPAAERAALLRSFREGSLRVLVNVYVLTEGWDCPETDAVILARGCGHVGMYLQIVGRALRPAPGKVKALCIDLCGSCHKIGYLPGDPIEYSLEGDAIRKAPNQPKLRQCLACGAVYRPGTTRVCPRCGHEVPPPPAPKVKRTDLGRIDRVTPPAVKREYYLAQRRLCQERGWNPGAASHRFQSRYGHWPSWQLVKEIDAEIRSGC